MDALIYTGAALSLGGLFALFWCIVSAIRARRARLDDDALRARLQKLVVLNLGALFASILGLMLIVVGIFLG
ncbi:hypothetical protein [Oceaniglobus indicus]|uniref:hypothetical protein n=1 Tax=Oceaniglobus indicus TaxID=2047749 RepID=UPI000C18CC16|nr:hypothetical protein [Oceaniglobus indicus]